MKPHPRIRKTIKWGGAAVTVLLVVVWVTSGWWGLLWSNGRGLYVLGGMGSIGLAFPPNEFLNAVDSSRPLPAYVKQRPSSGGFYWSKEPWRDFSWGFRWRPGTTYAAVPLWSLIPMPIGATFIAWRLDNRARRRAKLNLCPKCGYDRTGILQDAKCPECGAVPASV